MCMPVQAREEPTELYAQSAVLMDAESGRVLFSKNGMDVKAMASTTKIMTCILALEQGTLDGTATFSDRAARQPKVHLGAKSGEQFYLKDLLFSLMLESHNDTAVAIAEAVSGSVEAFADAMNEKAKEIGCENTYFITPNGLDDSDENGIHATTAVDLSRIMSYCVLLSPQKEEFLQITQAKQFQFSNLDQTRSYTCHNHNAFLDMMPEAVSGKTGFTADAGYCYVGAVKSEGRTFVIALLACGWPNNKSYKWSDMKKLVTYAMEHYSYRELDAFPKTESIVVRDGIPTEDDLFGQAKVATRVQGILEDSVLLHDEEKIEVKYSQVRELTAPVRAGRKVGKVYYQLDGETIVSYPIITTDDVAKKDYVWSFRMLFRRFLLG